MKKYTTPTAKFHRIVPIKMIASTVTDEVQVGTNVSGSDGPTTTESLSKRPTKIDLFSDDEE